MEPLCIVKNVKWCNCYGKHNGISSKISYKIAIWLSISTSGNIAKRIKSRDSTRYLCIHVHSHVIHNSPKKERAWVSMDGELNKQNVSSTYNRILFSLIKDRNSDTYYNQDETWRHYAKWTKPVIKGQILYNSTYMRNLEKSSS